MITRKPSVFIYTNHADPDFLREIRAGIEEEGVFSEIFERPEKDVSALAFEAAKDSMPGSGIGVSGVDVAMQMRGLSEGRDVSRFHMPTFEVCRRIGTNSARVIKKLGLKDMP